MCRWQYNVCVIWESYAPTPSIVRLGFKPKLPGKHVSENTEMTCYLSCGSLNSATYYFDRQWEIRKLTGFRITWEFQDRLHDYNSNVKLYLTFKLSSYTPFACKILVHKIFTNNVIVVIVIIISSNIYTSKEKKFWYTDLYSYRLRTSRKLCVTYKYATRCIYRVTKLFL